MREQEHEGQRGEAEGLELDPGGLVVAAGDVPVQRGAAEEEQRPGQVDLAPHRLGEHEGLLRDAREQHALADDVAAEQREREHGVDRRRLELDEHRILDGQRQAAEDRGQHGDHEVRLVPALLPHPVCQHQRDRRDDQRRRRHVDAEQQVGGEEQQRRRVVEQESHEKRVR